MAKGPTTTQNQMQQSQTNPWAPAQPLLSNILSQLGNVQPAITPTQSNALSQIETNATSIPNNLAPAEGYLANMFTGGGATNQVPTIQNAYNTLQTGLAPITNPGNLDPTKTPGIQSALDTVRNDVSNQVRSEFAGAGRPAGTNADVAQAEARGVAQAEAPILLGQYNTNVGNLMGAVGEQTGAATTAANAVTNLQQTALGNQGTAMAASPQLLSMANQGPMAALAAESARTGIPLGILGQLTGMGAGIAGLGSTSSGTMSGTTQQQQDPLSSILGAGFGGLGALGASGAFGSSGWLSTMLPMLAASDERVKENIAEVGRTFDDQPLYAFNYIGDEEPRVGLMAQDVERRDPQAVVEVGGVKMVDYERATRNARALGMLSRLGAF